MAFFKFRKGGDEPAASRQPPESVEVMRRRARHRLIGAGVLVLIGIVGFPLLFDTQPRPIAVDIPIDIPDRNKAKPLTAPAQPVAQAPSVSGPVTTAPAVEKAAPPASAAVAKAEAAPPAAKSEVAPAKAETKPESKAESKTVASTEKASSAASASVAKADTPQVKADDGAKAQALLEGKPVEVASAAPNDARFVVQVGAYADPALARETRLKVEKAGLKTYTHVAETKDGKRIRVRVGPFGTRAEADKAADKIKGLDLPAAILTL
jgi:DedD protein